MITTITNIGLNKHNKPYIQVTYAEGIFYVKCYIEVTSTDGLEVGQELNVPLKVLNQ